MADEKIPESIEEEVDTAASEGAGDTVVTDDSPADEAPTATEAAPAEQAPAATEAVAVIPSRTRRIAVRTCVRSVVSDMSSLGSCVRSYSSSRGARIYRYRSSLKA